MINAPSFAVSSGIKCSICKADIKERHKMYQTSLKLGVICGSCRKLFSGEEIEMIVNLFFAFGGYFGKFDKSEFSMEDVIFEFAEQLSLDNSKFHSQNIRLWHKVLTHGITPQEFLEELSVYVEQV